jgi:hypothetical protein
MPIYSIIIMLKCTITITITGWVIPTKTSSVMEIIIGIDLQPFIIIVIYDQYE